MQVQHGNERVQFICVSEKYYCFAQGFQRGGCTLVARFQSHIVKILLNAKRSNKGNWCLTINDNTPRFGGRDENLVGVTHRFHEKVVLLDAC